MFFLLKIFVLFCLTSNSLPRTRFALLLILSNYVLRSDAVMLINLFVRFFAFFVYLIQATFKSKCPHPELRTALSKSAATKIEPTELYQTMIRPATEGWFESCSCLDIRWSMRSAKPSPMKHRSAMVA